jgi:hypothetical protein|tara:strand:- start:1097 stop:1333 length:237 start_codon:yes stop_codon:yes gene_type:complete
MNGSISKIIPGSLRIASFNDKIISLSPAFDILLDNSIASIKKIKLDTIIVQKIREFKRLFEKYNDNILLIFMILIFRL